MSYYDNTAQYAARGIDGDLAACLEYNGAGIDLDEIARVLAVWEGENDGDDWRWVVATTDGRYAFIQGGCDYTGWDCQSNGWSMPADTAEAAANEARKAKSWKGNDEEVCQSLLKQIAKGKEQTWREGMDKEMLG